MSAPRVGRIFLGLTCVAAGITAAAFFGCVDIFHSTDFPSPDAGPLDFCSWSEATAKQNATHACALVAACESPNGDNAVGTCLANATLAYDCVANPNRPVIGAAHAYWECVARAKSCEDVSGCVYGDPPAIGKQVTPPTCGSPAPFTTCGKGSESSARLDCRVSNQAAVGESCVSSGRSCVAKNGGEALCVGEEGVACRQTGCGDGGTKLDLCVDAGGGDAFDRGVDCASFGAGRCVDVGFGPTCAPSDAGPCGARAGISCLGDIAVGCGSGISEQVDCSKLATGVTCNANAAAPSFDIAAGCFARAPACSSDTCSGNGVLLACVRGVVVSVDCGALGLGNCSVVTTSDGPRASCGAP